MPLLATWDEHPPASKAHLKDRMERLPRPQGGVNRVKAFFRADREVPAAKWYLDFGDFIVVGDGIYLGSYLGPDEMSKVEGYELRCWRQNKADARKCWRNKGTLRKPKASIEPMSLKRASREVRPLSLT